MPESTTQNTINKFTSAFMPKGENVNPSPQTEIPPTNTVNPDRIVKPSQTLLEWTVPERIFKKKNKEFFRRVALIVIFVAFFFFVLKEFLLIIVLGVFFFVIYIFYTIPPNNVTHQITTNGINYAKQYLYPWEELKNFFISEKDGYNLLNINTYKPLPGRITLLLSEEMKKEDVERVVNEYISIVENPQEEPLDKFSRKITSKIKF